MHEGGSREEDVGSSALSDSKGDVDETELGRIAVERKLITPEQLQDCLDEIRKNPQNTLKQLLVGRGWLDVDQLIRIMTEHRKPDDVPPELARYDVRGRLGEGTSAVVYRAWDRQLGRWVAMKVLRDA